MTNSVDHVLLLTRRRQTRCMHLVLLWLLLRLVDSSCVTERRIQFVFSSSSCLLGFLVGWPRNAGAFDVWPFDTSYIKPLSFWPTVTPASLVYVVRGLSVWYLIIGIVKRCISLTVRSVIG